MKSIYSGAIDVAGGEILASILKQIKSGGSVSCRGLVSSATLNTTVLPFILRGINLLGVDSAEISREKKQAMWQALSASAIPEKLDITNHCISLEEVPDHLRRMHKEGLQSHILVNNQQ